MMLQARRLCRSRRETAFSPESKAGSSEAKAMEALSAFRGRDADRRCGVLELAAD